MRLEAQQKYNPNTTEWIPVAEQMPRQIDALIDRNQEMLQVSEEMKNKNNLGNVEMLGYVPMVLFSANMVVSMIILVVNMMAKINEMMVI